MNKDIKLLIENIFQREGARELLKKSKAEEIDAQIRKMYLYHPETKEELEDNIIECLENETNLNWIDVSEINNFTVLFNRYYRLGKYIQQQNITSIDISGWYIRSDANAKDMFQGSTLNEIVLPNNLHKIYNGMFYKSSLTSVTIPNSVTSIGNDAFYDCRGLTSVTIPDKVTSIGDRAFVYCCNLTSITIVNSVIDIADTAFYSCRDLETIYVDDVEVFMRKYPNMYYNYIEIKPIKEKPINENIFQRENARELLKKSKAEELDAQIRKMYLYHPKTREELEDNIIECFKNETDLNLIDVSEIDDFKELFYGFNKIGEYIEDNRITSIDISGWYIRSDANVENMFQSSTLEEIVLPNNLHKIEDVMFWNSHLKSVFIPDSVTSIGDVAFSYCGGLTSVNIPDSVTSIGGGAFWCCYNLKSIIILNSVIDIAENAFDSCRNLQTIYVDNVEVFKSKCTNVDFNGAEIKSIKEKPINENIFQRKGARKLLKRSKAEEIVRCSKWL